MHRRGRGGVVEAMVLETSAGVWLIRSHVDIYIQVQSGCSRMNSWTWHILIVRALLWCFWDTWEVPNIPLISIVNFYYIINKLIIYSQG
jgi:hypothetical protein